MVSILFRDLRQGLGGVCLLPMRCALSCLLHPLCVVVGTGAHVPLYNSVTVSFFCFLTHAPTVCARARGMYVRNLFLPPPSYLSSSSSLSPRIPSHCIASHVTLRSHDYNLLRFITIYSLDFSLSLTPSTWHRQRAKGNGGTHPSSALRRDATLGILLVFDVCI